MPHETKQSLAEQHAKSIARFQKSWGLAGGSASAPRSSYESSQEHQEFLERQQEKALERFRAKHPDEIQSVPPGKTAESEAAPAADPKNRLQILEGLAEKFGANVAPSIRAEIGQLRAAVVGAPAESPTAKTPGIIGRAVETVKSVAGMVGDTINKIPIIGHAKRAAEWIDRKAGERYGPTVNKIGKLASLAGFPATGIPGLDMAVYGGAEVFRQGKNLAGALRGRAAFTGGEEETGEGFADFMGRRRESRASAAFRETMTAPESAGASEKSARAAAAVAKAEESAAKALNAAKAAELARAEIAKAKTPETRQAAREQFAEARAAASIAKLDAREAAREAKEATRGAPRGRPFGPGGRPPGQFSGGGGDFDFSPPGKRDRGGAGGILGGIRLGPLGIPLAAFGAIKAAEGVARFAGNAIATSQNVDLTAEQRNRQIADSIPIVGGLIKSFRELGYALDGTTEAMRQATLRHQENLAADRSQTAATAAVNQERMALAGAHAAAIATGAVAPTGRPLTVTGFTAGATGYAPLRQFDRQSLAGAQAYRDYQRLLPLQDRSVQLERQATIAAVAHGNAALHLREAGERRERAAHAAERAEFRHRAMVQGLLPSTPRSLQTAAMERERTIKQKEDAERAYQEQLRLARGASAEMAQARSGIRQGRIAEQRGQLQILEERRERTMASLEAFGSANPVERQLGLAALRQFREIGEAAGPEVMAYAQRFAPDYVRQRQREIAEASPERQQAIREGFLRPDEAQPIAQQERIINQTAANIRVNVNIDEQMLSRDLLTAFRSAYGDLIRSIQTQVRDIQRDIQGGRAVVNAQNR